MPPLRQIHRRREAGPARGDLSELTLPLILAGRPVTALHRDSSPFVTAHGAANDVLFRQPPPIIEGGPVPPPIRLLYSFALTFEGNSMAIDQLAVGDSVIGGDQGERANPGGAARNQPPRSTPVSSGFFARRRKAGEQPLQHHFSLPGDFLRSIPLPALPGLRARENDAPCFDEQRVSGDIPLSKRGQRKARFHRRRAGNTDSNSW